MLPFHAMSKDFIKHMLLAFARETKQMHKVELPHPFPPLSPPVSVLFLPLRHSLLRPATCSGQKSTRRLTRRSCQPPLSFCSPLWTSRPTARVLWWRSFPKESTRRALRLHVAHSQPSALSALTHSPATSLWSNQSPGFLVLPESCVFWQAKDELSSLEPVQAMEPHMGALQEWYSLYGKCYEVSSDNSFKYKLCPFSQLKQVSPLLTG